MGTPAYMSPEQCRSARSAVDRSDVYALGVIMYEMLAGETPFRGGPALLMAGHLTMDPPALSARVPSTPPELAALVHRMLAKNPSDRPTAEEVVRSLGPSTGALSVVSPPADSPTTLPLSPTSVQGTETLHSPAAKHSASPLASLSQQQQRKIIFGAALAVLLLGMGGVTSVLLLSGTSRESQKASPAADLGSPYPAIEDTEPKPDAGALDTRPPSVASARKTNPPKGTAEARPSTASKGKKSKGASAKKRGSRRSTE